MEPFYLFLFIFIFVSWKNLGPSLNESWLVGSDRYVFAKFQNNLNVDVINSKKPNAFQAAQTRTIPT